jgi:membrane protease YdiL (CAAX protease family)
MMLNWLFAAGVAVLMMLVGYGTVRTGRLLRVWTPPRNLLLSGPDSLAHCLLIGLCLLLGATVGPGPDQLGWQTDHLTQYLLAGTVAGLALATALNLGGQAAVRHWGPQVSSTKLLQCVLPIDSREWFGVTLALVPAAALEELLYRSLPLGGLGCLLQPWLLLWPLALLFGLLHWPQGGWGVAGATLAAIVFSYLFLVTGSIWTPLAAHYVMNMHQLVLAKHSGLSPLRAG